jgi:hypothetical protein
MGNRAWAGDSQKFVSCGLDHNFWLGGWVYTPLVIHRL